ncbi:hypothetical protein E3N88_41977 [Mikania micrantha]|uniref:VQ domain-containing protein n=1 Tax=Mikania micrantha TaxID=192012 RepID=A0A5N6LJ30_9ASTR|nr:hypothetical protein E3N88_41977 [Mikania micrantha]
MDSGAADDDQYDSRTESISFFLNPNPNPTHQPTFFEPFWSTNTGPDPTFTGSVITQKDDDCLHSQPPASPNTYMGPGSGHHQLGPSTKRLKKRSRASKRPPTTVLTTDTNNFRQMVQEFTGIPTAPLYPVRTAIQRFQLQQPLVASVDGSSRSYKLHHHRRQHQIHRFQKEPNTSQNPISLIKDNVLMGATKSDDQQFDVLQQIKWSVN